LATFVAATGAMALAQYFINTGISATGLRFEDAHENLPHLDTHYLWTSITYISAASSPPSQQFVRTRGLRDSDRRHAGISVVLLHLSQVLDEIKASAEQAEQAERERAEAESARAEAERARAEQAERHVEELNRHIAEQARISAQLQESKDHFRHAAFHDTLTNLPIARYSLKTSSSLSSAQSSTRTINSPSSS
jgi:hypothetical protein